jgi:hypothetical protein
MAEINVKERKRVLRGDLTPYKELSLGDKQPRFRQNGYQLKFDSANSDYLDVDYLTNWVNLSEANFKVTFEVSAQSTDTRTVYCDGGFKDAVTGLIRFIINPNSYGLFCYVTGVNNADLENIAIDLGGAGVYEVGLNGLDLVVNGQTVHTFTEKQINFTNTSFKPTISKVSYQDSFYSDFRYYDLEIDGETFDLEESRGTTITGSQGTTGTINTSHASGITYIDSTVWEKKSFALAFDSANSEYADVDYLTNWVNLSDADFKVKFEIFGQSPNTRIIYCDGIFNNSAAGLIRFLINPNSYTLVVVCTSKNNANFESHFEDLGGAGTYEVGLNGLDLVVNGQTVFTFTEKAIDLTNSNYKPTISKASYVDSFYSDFRYYELEIDLDIMS